MKKTLDWFNRSFVKSVNSSAPDSNGNVTVATYSHPSTHPASMITGLSTVATSGNYNDLSNRPSSLLPIGSVIAYAANSAPDGYLLCNGAAVSRTTYADLFAKIGTTYGSGNGSTTFNLPNLTDKFIQGSGTAGTVKSAGLPNISGTVLSPRVYEKEHTSGAFYYASTSGIIIPAGTGNDGAVDIYMNASRSSSIYGNSSTVQPPALTMRYYIKY